MQNMVKFICGNTSILRQKTRTTDQQTPPGPIFAGFCRCHFGVDLTLVGRALVGLPVAGSFGIFYTSKLPVPFSPCFMSASLFGQKE